MENIKIDGVNKSLTFWISKSINKLKQTKGERKTILQKQNILIKIIILLFIFMFLFRYFLLIYFFSKLSTHFQSINFHILIFKVAAKKKSMGWVEMRARLDLFTYSKNSTVIQSINYYILTFKVAAKKAYVFTNLFLNLCISHSRISLWREILKSFPLKVCNFG